MQNPIFNDLLFGYFLEDIPYLIFHILIAVLVSYIVGLLYKNKEKPTLNAVFWITFLGGITAVTVVIVKNSVSLSLLALLPLFFLVKLILNSDKQFNIHVILALLVGLIAGAGSSLLLLVLSPFIFLLLWKLPQC